MFDTEVEQNIEGLGSRANVNGNVRQVIRLTMRYVLTREG